MGLPDFAADAGADVPLDPAAFLGNYWQKSPCSGAWHGEMPVLHRDELAWLATQPDVESRLVFTARNDRTTWSVEHGPFDEADLEGLPDSDWTLLVQDVDKHLPDFRAWFGVAPFVPGWRFDDLMISLAAPGGSVGPHLDRYDVFLCQVEGCREWRIGDPEHVQPDPASGALALLAPFDPQAIERHRPGSMLYLPPGVPHWGVAEDISMTYSVGCRAPTAADLGAAAAGADERFYADPDLRADEADGAWLHPRAIDRAREQSLVPAAWDERTVAAAIGTFVTRPKQWLTPEACEPDEPAELAARGQTIRVHGMAMLCCYRLSRSVLAFANGRSLVISGELGDLFADVARERALSPDLFFRAQASPGGRQMLDWLAATGSLDPLPAG